MDFQNLRNLHEPIFYVTNDVGKGIGLENILPNYHIVCLDDHPLVDILLKDGVSVFCLERTLGKKNVLSRTSGKILEHNLVKSFIKEKSKCKRANILFFKPQKKIEIITKNDGFSLIGNPVNINRIFEDKVTFFNICQKEKINVPPGEIRRLTEINFKDLNKKYGEPFVVQFGRGWAGNTTFFIRDGADFTNLQKKYPCLKVKISKFIKGLTVLNNAAIYNDQVFISHPALQIKASLELTSTQGGTGGRQWPVNLEKKQLVKIKQITNKVGKIMVRSGYRGFFGLDFLVEEKSGEIFLSENNARLTASAPFYTKLEIASGVFPLLGYHLLAFLNDKKKVNSYYESPAILGSEIVARNTENQSVKVSGNLKTGIYGKNFEFKKEASFLETSGGEDFWLQTAANRRIINPEIEVVKINTYAQVCDRNGNLKLNYKNLVQRVKRELKLEKCEEGTLSEEK